MAARSGFGQWLEGALRARGMRPAELARGTNKSRSAISQLISGAILPSEPLRREIAQALRISVDEVPPADIKEKESPQSSAGPAMTVSYFEDGDEPPPSTLRVIDNGIPDHQIPRLANDLGYFAPFNIALDIEERPETDYPHGQQQVFRAQSPLNPPTLVSGPWRLFTEGPRTFIARVNRYTGYALITRYKTTLTPVFDAKGPEQKLTAFLELMRRIVDRRAERNVSFVDDPAQRFYRMLFDLYGTLTNQQIPPGTGLSSAYAGTLLDRLDDIGEARADFVVGHANTAALANREGRAYKILIEYSDIVPILNGVLHSRTLMSALMESADAASEGKAATPSKSTRRQKRSGSLDAYEDEANRQATYSAFRKPYEDRLREVTLNNVWAVNFAFDDIQRSTDLLALACRVAGIAYRTAKVLEQDGPKREEALRQILGYARTEAGAAGQISATDRVTKERADRDRFDNFKSVWNRSYKLTSFENVLAWVGESTYLSAASGNYRQNRESLKYITETMALKRKEYQDAIAKLPAALPPAAERHRLRADHHFNIFSYWDAAAYALKALRILDQPNSIGGANARRAGR